MPLTDALEIITNNGGDAPSFDSSGISIPGQVNENICLKAWQILKNDFPQLPPVSIHLHKNIPIGAGLGGGSADGAFMLKMLNKKFSLGIEPDQLLLYAASLGSDVPFFIKNTACYATGRGEVLKEIDLHLSSYQLALINPGIHINTAEAFRMVKPQPERISVFETLQQPIENWKQKLVNDFELPVAAQHPEIATIKEELYNAGAVYAAMTGTGSTVFGIFAKDVAIKLNFPAHYFVKITSDLSLKWSKKLHLPPDGNL